MQCRTSGSSVRYVKPIRANSFFMKNDVTAGRRAQRRLSSRSRAFSAPMALCQIGRGAALDIGRARVCAARQQQLEDRQLVEHGGHHQRGNARPAPPRRRARLARAAGSPSAGRPGRRRPRAATGRDRWRAPCRRHAAAARAPLEVPVVARQHQQAVALVVAGCWPAPPAPAAAPAPPHCRPGRSRTASARTRRRPRRWPRSPSRRLRSSPTLPLCVPFVMTALRAGRPLPGT